MDPAAEELRQTQRAFGQKTIFSSSEVKERQSDFRIRRFSIFQKLQTLRARFFRFERGRA
jgi:hypothetical protein